MRVAVSNLAWEADRDPAVAQALRRSGIDAIDVVPGRYFPDPAAATREQVRAVRDWWREQGMEIVGMQSLLFRADGLNVFGPPDIRDHMLLRLEAVCRLGGWLGAGPLVFGAPRNRDASGLGAGEALDIAVAFFRRLGAIAVRYGVRICVEPVPPRYGCNFMTTSAAAAAVVTAVDHEGIRLQLDTGTLRVTGENVETVLAAQGAVVGHVHASEPDLVALGSLGARGVDHEAVAATLRRLRPDLTVSIEMLPVPEPVAQVEAAARLAQRAYGNVLLDGAAQVAGR
jgi:sugar phosphate isomerase/epimerase